MAVSHPEISARAVCEIVVPTLIQFHGPSSSNVDESHVKVSLPWVSILACEPPASTDRRYAITHVIEAPRL